MNSPDFVAITTPNFRGTYERIGFLEHAFAHDDLLSLVRGGHLLASSNGKQIAHLRTNNDYSMTPVVNRERLKLALWQMSGSEKSRPRLLGFHNDSLLVSGGLSDGRTGVFRCSKGGVEQVSRCDEVVGVQPSISGPLVFVRSSTDPPDERRLVLSTIGSDLTIHDRTFVTGISAGRALVLDVIDGTTHRYIVGPNGFEDVCSVPIEPNANIVGIVRWNGMCVIGIRHTSSSELRVLGTKSWDLVTRSIAIEGQLECLWQSPTHQTYAWLSRVENGKNTTRRLVVGDETFIDGPFTMGQNDLVWSPNGRMICAKLHTDIDGKNVCVLVSPSQQIKVRSKLSVIDFCVDDEGNIPAWVATDGKYYRPFVRKRPHDAVVYAWNLWCMPDNAVSYNCVHGHDVQLIVDRTDLKS